MSLKGSVLVTSMCEQMPILERKSSQCDENLFQLHLAIAVREKNERIKVLSE